MANRLSFLGAGSCLLARANAWSSPYRYLASVLAIATVVDADPASCATASAGSASVPSAQDATQLGSPTPDHHRVFDGGDLLQHHRLDVGGGTRRPISQLQHRLVVLRPA
eukprot:CAMPEP_0175883772 /NCGR_PEP_ID=MMETSP0107_2-20121207/44162_1 /TAXON_ID=195067 ORGANISM="Goniomonas pacifica, Strain CCMP1869" /NCGR_SAMPLE_ID=MMETSP0107_2 /ASSEMBLY_ACC=CAM_ASM_000203 /LENGTH=109 /DNA_ID=CAMNT_0017203871 /DNA_START=175 /DNA_END=500 /DNA_ORIENTATION=-